MKKIFRRYFWLLLFAFAVPLLAMLPWKERKLQQYFPLTDGSWWEYAQYDTWQRELTLHDSIVCKGDTLIGGKQYQNIARGKSYSGFPSGYYRFEGTAVYRYNQKSGHEYLLADFSEEKGTTHEVTQDTISATFSVRNTDTTFVLIMSRIQLLNDTAVTKETITYDHTYCTEWKGLNPQYPVYMYFKKEIGLVGVEIGRHEVIYLRKWHVNKPKKKK